jgi:hypothetical protein
MRGQFEQPGAYSANGKKSVSRPFFVRAAVFPGREVMVNTRRAWHVRLGVSFAVFAVFAARGARVPVDNYLPPRGRAGRSAQAGPD